MITATPHRRLLSAALVLALTGPACNKKDRAPAGASAGSGAPAVQASGSGSGAGPEAKQPAPTPTLLPPPLRTQLEHEMTALKVLGWTLDGKLFAVQGTHGRDMGELAGRDMLVLRQVHDALTGAMVASFKVARLTDKGEPSSKQKNAAWEEALPEEQWAEWKKQNPLTNARGSDIAPGEAGRVVGRRLGGVPEGTRFDLIADDQGMRFNWLGFRPGGKGEHITPGVKVLLFRTDRPPLELLTFRLRYTHREVIELAVAPDTRYQGRVQAHFSPAGDRVLLVITADSIGTNEEQPMDSARFHVRALGPQLRLAAPPAAGAAARSLARRLAAAGMPVTQLALEGKPRKTTIILHRGRDGEALARQLAARIEGPTELSELKKKGWLRLVVLLGSGALKQ